jgi:hypothetical protein
MFILEDFNIAQIYAGPYILIFDLENFDKCPKQKKSGKRKEMMSTSRYSWSST